MRNASRRPTVVLATLLSFLVIVSAIGSVALAVCIPSSYFVTGSAPPPVANWTDTTGAVWSPAGGFPGCAPGDSATNTNASPTTLIVNSSIPNPIVGLNMSCAGCTIDIQSGGSLTLAGAGSMASATTLIVEPGGTLTIANGGSLTFNNGSSLSSNGGTLGVNGGTMTVNNSLTVQSSGTLSLASATVNGTNTTTNNGTLSQGGGDSTISCALNTTSSGNVSVLLGN